jgi:hypothetical protein
MWIKIETDDVRDGLRFIENVQRHGIANSRNKIGNVGGPGSAIRVSRAFAEMTAEDLSQLELTPAARLAHVIVSDI